MGNLFFGSSGSGNRLRVNVKDLRTGRITTVNVPRPHEVRGIKEERGICGFMSDTLWI